MSSLVRAPLLALLFLVTALSAETAAGGNSLGRDRDPVLLTGSDLTGLIGVDPARIVAFRWSAGAWSQIPVQVDERDIVDFGTVYNTTPSGFT
ncbi:MAG: hypothetical protein HKN20_01545, partial [Gemmatimonadetes bacterium]|nr:hypothetical protein [Gemmatimonadota bacterium]